MVERWQSARKKNMAAWAKEEIELKDGTKAAAQMPVYYCYANTNNAAALENWTRHCACPHAETITEEI